jgi:hypothetical protein
MAGFRNNFQVHRRLTEKRVIGCYQKGGTSFLQWVTGRIFTLLTDFQKGKQEMYFGFLHKKAAKKQKNCENHQRSYKKY